MTGHQKEDYRLPVTILTDKYKVENVLCKVYLPSRLTNSIDLFFYPDEDQILKLDEIFEFSIVGEQIGFSGEVEVRIQADKIYLKNRSTTHWSRDIKESIFVGNPTSLKVVRLLHQTNVGLIQNRLGCFWLTPSTMLAPSKLVERSVDGNIKVETGRQFKFALTSFILLVFDKQFRFIEDENGDEITFSELVAEFNTEKGALDFFENNIMEHLDDFLLLVSFVERSRCVCLGWEITDNEGYTRYYRRNLAIPDLKKPRGFFDALFDLQDFEEFIELAYDRFNGIEVKELIRHAIQYTIAAYSTDKTLESSFLSLYTALETLVLHFRRTHGMESVFVSEWNEFQDDLKKWLRNYPMLKNGKGKRILIYEKLPELNRISFSTAFNHFCAFYSIDLSDLWPVLKNSRGISISEIRNKLIHGETFNPLQLGALMAAKEHLQWIMERLILAVLDWPISRSRVNKEFLEHYMACHKDWVKDQEVLSA